MYADQNHLCSLSNTLHTGKCKNGPYLFYAIYYGSNIIDMCLYKFERQIQLCYVVYSLYNT